MTHALIEQALNWLCATQQELQYLHAETADIPGQIADLIRELQESVAEKRGLIVDLTQALSNRNDTNQKQAATIEALQTQVRYLRGDDIVGGA